MCLALSLCLSVTLHSFHSRSNISFVHSEHLKMVIQTFVWFVCLPIWTKQSEKKVYLAEKKNSRSTFFPFCTESHVDSNSFIGIDWRRSSEWGITRSEFVLVMNFTLVSLSYRNSLLVKQFAMHWMMLTTTPLISCSFCFSLSKNDWKPQTVAVSIDCSCIFSHSFLYCAKWLQ